jgi:hypothetical protein
MRILNPRLQVYFYECIPKVKKLRNDSHTVVPASIICENLKNYPPFRDQGENLGCNISDPLSMNPVFCPEQGGMIMTLLTSDTTVMEKKASTHGWTNMKKYPWTTRICFFQP